MKKIQIDTVEGKMEAMRYNVTLNKTDNDFNIIERQPAISTKGYNKLNEFSGITILSPQNIGHGSNDQAEYGPSGIRRVTSRRIAIGYTPIGTLCMCDETVTFDVEMYLKQSVFSKWKKVRNIARLGIAPKSEAEAFSEIFVPIIGDQGLYVNPDHEEAIKIINDYLNKQKFANRIAAGMAKRNALRSHPAISTSTISVRGNLARVTVYGFRHFLSQKSIESVVDKAVAGEAVSGVEIFKSESTPDHQDVQAVIEDDPDTGESTSSGIVDCDRVETDTAIVTKIIRRREEIGKEAYEKALNGRDIFTSSTEELNGIFTDLKDIGVAGK